jgi:hypothetical protein
LCYLALFDGHTAGAVALPPEGPAPEAILSEARLSLAEARKTHSDSRAALGWYLQAADRAVRAASESSSSQANEARLIYNSASEEVTVLLWSNRELWNKAETIACDKGLYQLRFAAGSHKDGTWDPTYFDVYRSQQQVHEKISRQTASSDSWGGILVGVRKPPDPRRYFLPRVGVACPITVILDFRPSGAAAVECVRLLSYYMTPRGEARFGWQARDVPSIAAGLIRLPGRILARETNGSIATLQKDVGIKHPPTSINGLSPRSPVLRGLDSLNISAPYHSIIGDRGRGDTPNSSDGVVAYWSSHLAGSQSELIVPGSHGSFALPQTVSELKRILRLNLSVASAPHRSTTSRGQH